jgi:uncharacterized protein (TIRG00374 family)
VFDVGRSAVSSPLSGPINLNTKTSVSLALGLAVSAAALYLAFRNVPIEELVGYLATINYFWIVPTAALGIASFALRTLRWQVILGASRNIGFSKAFHPLMIGFMLNCILPGRIGELARPAILQKKEKIPFAIGLATVAAERVFDIAILVLLFAGVLAFVPIDPELEMAFGKYRLNSQTLNTILLAMLQLTFALVLGIILLSVGSVRRLIVAAINKAPRLLFFLPGGAQKWVQERIAAALVRIVENFALGFETVKQPRAVAVCAGFSFLIWGVQGVSFFVFSLACPGVDLTPPQALAVLVIISFFIALPSVPGFWGLWEAGGIFALALFGIASREAAGYTLANHAIQIFPVIIVGLFSAFVTGVDIRQVSRIERGGPAG